MQPIRPFCPLFALVVVALPLPCALAGDYRLSINGAVHELSLDQPLDIVGPDGAALRLELSQKPLQHFAGHLFAMQHPRELKPSTSDLGDNVYQTMMATPRGTAVIVQEYLDMNPELLVDLMIRELTKEERDYGYRYEEQPIVVNAGTYRLAGKEARTTYAGEVWTRTVYALGVRDRGLLIVTMIEEDGAHKEEQKLIDQFWQSLDLSRLSSPRPENATY